MSDNFPRQLKTSKWLSYRKIKLFLLPKDVPTTKNVSLANLVRLDKKFNRHDDFSFKELGEKQKWSQQENETWPRNSEASISEATDRIQSTVHKTQLLLRQIVLLEITVNKLNVKLTRLRTSNTAKGNHWKNGRDDSQTEQPLATITPWKRGNSEPKSRTENRWLGLIQPWQAVTLEVPLN